MPIQIQSNRNRMWFARGMMVILAVVAIWLFLSGPGTIKVVNNGTTTTYFAPSFFSLISAALGIMICILGGFYWKQPVLFFRFVAAILILLGIYCLFNSPTGLNHRVIVTPDYFLHRVGSWYSPVETKVEFESLADIAIVKMEADSKPEHETYALQCFTKEGRGKVEIPIYDMMKKALPEILKRAAQHKVVLGKNVEGWQIPPELRE